MSILRLRRTATAGAARFVLTSLALLAAHASAQADFALGISPPRFEIEAKPGETLRQAMTITNGGSRGGTFKVSTADWSLAQNGTVTFTDELSPESCRPWVAIERRSVNMAAGGQYRFRFEVTPPADVAPRECRFAILIEGDSESANAGGVNVPIAARMAVIVYLGVGGVQPELSVVEPATQVVDGRTTPVLLVRNTGQAHGRAAGFLSGSDASGARFDFSPSTAPILPGETRAIPLVASRAGESGEEVTLRFPVSIKGKLEWSGGKSNDIDLRFGP